VGCRIVLSLFQRFCENPTTTNSTRKIQHCKQASKHKFQTKHHFKLCPMCEILLNLFSFLSTQSSLMLFSLMLYLSSKHQSSVVEEQEEDAK
jgi:hypothetical protein